MECETLTEPLLWLSTSILNDLDDTSPQSLNGWNVVGKDTHVTSSSRDVDLRDTLRRVKGLHDQPLVISESLLRAETDLMGESKRKLQTLIGNVGVTPSSDDVSGKRTGHSPESGSGTEGGHILVV